MHYLLQILIIHHLYITVLASYKPCSFSIYNVTDCHPLDLKHFRRNFASCARFPRLFIDRYSNFIGYLDQTYPLNWHPATHPSPKLQSHSAKGGRGPFLKGPEGNMSKIKSIMIIHFAKTSAQLKSTAFKFHSGQTSERKSRRALVLKTESSKRCPFCPGTKVSLWLLLKMSFLKFCVQHGVVST